jgi:S-DNA-T family DNA segregation ATPase FtsK/SpoIIIE
MSTLLVASSIPRCMYWWRFAVTGAGVGRRLVRPPRSFRLGRFAEVASGGTEVAGRVVFRDVPRMSHYSVSSDGWSARVKLRPGQHPDVMVNASSALAHAFRAGAVTIGPGDRPGYVRMRVMRHDPLREPCPWPPVALTPTTFRLGRGDDGLPWLLDLMELPHWLVTGATGSGKSSILHAVFVAAARTDCAILGADLKFGLEQVGWLPRLTDLATDQEQAVELLNRLLDVAGQRAAVCRQERVNSVFRLPEGHPCRRLVLVIVDELAELLILNPDAKELGKALSTLLLRSVQLLRALGVSLIFAGQRFSSDLGPTATGIRSQLGGRVVARVSDAESARMSLGDSTPDAVEAALQISPDMPGTAIVAGPLGWRRVRAAYVTGEDAARVADDTASQRVTWADLAGEG